ncbi:uncharacterized protein LOC133850302 [Drosophila sulfurigaster albostrigata]|uniref:uncharacterized protein LOC133850302 n=1 Tax=Drosophila sulfurigaster albostrigata TaxID=89887 RepID=UPI002D21DF7E|nr:uncharacterized protein LOC133850302 [Drosophila sulfurigaster albostrigata]
MSEPLSSSGLRIIYNSLLLLTSGLTARKLSMLKHPFAFGACVVGGAVAVLGLLRGFYGNDRDPEQFQMLRDVSHGVLELVPLPLVNMELYTIRLGVGPLVIGHGIFVLPLLIDLHCSVVKERKNCWLAETLRDLLLLGNIVSLGYLAVRESSSLYMRMAFTMVVIKYTPVVLDNIHDNTGEDMLVYGSALFFYFLGRADVLTAD